MSKYGKVEAASRKRKSILKNLQAHQKFVRMNNEYEEDDHHQNLEEHLQVEMDWGEEDQTTDSHGESIR